MMEYRTKPETRALVAAIEPGQKKRMGGSTGASFLQQRSWSKDE